MRNSCLWSLASFPARPLFSLPLILQRKLPLSIDEPPNIIQCLACITTKTKFCSLTL